MGVVEAGGGEVRRGFRVVVVEEGADVVVLDEVVATAGVVEWEFAAGVGGVVEVVEEVEVECEVEEVLCEFVLDVE